MIKKYYILGLLLLVFAGQATLAQVVKEKYWVAFTDKNNNTYSLSNPEAFLSQRALDRRIRQDISLDERDLPVTHAYLDSLLAKGARVLSTSKWLNGATIETDSAEIAQKVAQLSFVDSIALSWTSLSFKSASMKLDVEHERSINVDTSAYGTSFRQLEINNHLLMHDEGFRGEGMLIAVLDGGFFQVDSLPAFDSLRNAGRILGVRDFVDQQRDFYDSNRHGMMVLSCMGGILPGQLMGSAPDASFFLITTEDGASEFPVEMDNWVAGAELADSIGADIINSSLGYFTFDDASMSYSYADMDGKTTRVSRGADIAASRGMLVVCSAGNEGSKEWQQIIAPSDGFNVLCVGSIDQDSMSTSFSSRGPSFDGRVKPNVLANGRGVTVQSTSDTPTKDYVEFVNGTSFSSPLMAGMAACLWQALPEKTVLELKQLLEESSHLYASPNANMGYGIPNIFKAYSDHAASTNPISSGNNITIYYSQLTHALMIDMVGAEAVCELFDLSGRRLMTRKIDEHAPEKLFLLKPSIRNAVIIARITTSKHSISQKIIIP